MRSYISVNGSYVMRSAPSIRIVSPFRYPLVMMWCAREPYSSVGMDVVKVVYYGIMVHTGQCLVCTTVQYVDTGALV